ncbi:MAG: 4-hydroxybenzoate octaprenyltransferase [Calditrichaeota bacterium]|nr:MAG: 4-hydroxybenzoate octaprenyltransferase [Calditrichota bacterium]
MISKILDFGRMVKFSHSIFALPFAFTGAFLAFERGGFSWEKVLWIALCMVTARNVAMGFNRLVDRKIDAKNPRTIQREIASGKISSSEGWFFVLLNAIIFAFSAKMLSNLCLILSPFVLAILCFYSLTKRFTWLAHIFLGLAISLSPTAAWIAVAGEVELLPILISAVILFWIAGFDIIYACQDFEFDIQNKLHSIPAKFGISKALMISRVFHLITFGLLVWVGVEASLQWIYFSGAIVIGGILFYEQSLVKPNDLSKVDKAFFDMNGIISVLFFVIVFADLKLL